ncbi:g9085 [Coccomyxa elongata]
MTVVTQAKKGKDSDTISALREALDVGRRSELDQAYQEGGAFLRSIGFEANAEISRILDVAMNPNSLFVTLRDKKRAGNASARRLDVEQDMKPVVDCLRSCGLEQAQIVKVISDHPAVLCYSPDERIKPFFEYLASIGIGPEKIARRPSLLGLEVNASLRRIVNYLQEVDGKTVEELAQLLETI